LIQEEQLAAYEYDGYFAAMDTFKDKQQLDDLSESGDAPWEVWKARVYGDPSKAGNRTDELKAGKPSRVPLSDRHA
jgi:NDP-sugar pyrophosphorylase family protein